MRVLLDANIFISYLLPTHEQSPITRIVRAGILGKYRLLIPQDLIDEFARKTHEKKYLAERITPEGLSELISVLDETAEKTPKITQPIPAVTRDPKDDYLLAYATVWEADYLVSGDEDLRALGRVGKVQIVSPREFVEILESS